jgi:hypothetical protein
MKAKKPARVGPTIWHGERRGEIADRLAGLFAMLPLLPAKDQRLILRTTWVCVPRSKRRALARKYPGFFTHATKEGYGSTRARKVGRTR